MACPTPQTAERSTFAGLAQTLTSITSPTLAVTRSEMRIETPSYWQLSVDFHCRRLCQNDRFLQLSGHSGLTGVKDIAVISSQRLTIGSEEQSGPVVASMS